jgi:hypothetical protein
MPKAFPQEKRGNAPWTPLQRRTWLAERRRRSRQNHLLPAPVLLVLSSDGHGNLSWTCNLASDYGFNICHSADGVTWDNGFDFIDEGRMQVNESGCPGYFRVSMMEANGSPILPFSNVVYSDGSRDN